MIEPTEDFEQRTLANRLRGTDLIWCHVPNGGKRDKRVAAQMRRHGVMPGVPDILIFTPGHDGKPTAIELKRIKSGRVSKEQKQWLVDLAECGWHTEVSKGADAAWELINERYR